MANGSTSSKDRMQKMVTKVNGPVHENLHEPIKVKSKPAADILGDTHYKGVPFSTDSDKLYSEQQQRGRARMSSEERHEFSKRERVSKGKKHQQHPLFTIQGVVDFNKQGQIDRYKSSDHSSKTPNNPEDTQKYHSSNKGLLQKAPEYTAKPVSKKVEKFHKRETKREQRILKKDKKKQRANFVKEMRPYKNMKFGNQK